MDLALGRIQSTAQIMFSEVSFFLCLLLGWLVSACFHSAVSLFTKRIKWWLNVLNSHYLSLATSAERKLFPTPYINPREDIDWPCLGHVPTHKLLSPGG